MLDLRFNELSKSDARDPITIEHQTVYPCYSVKQKRPEINLMESAKMNSHEKLLAARISSLRKNPDTMQTYICHLNDRQS